MPELPEVEHQARWLRRWLDGNVIVQAEADPTPMLRANTTARSFAERLSGRTVTNIDRRAKFLLFNLNDGHTLLSHLGMTGKWVRRMATDPGPTFSRARLYLSDGSILHDTDSRMFGRLSIVSTDALAKSKELRDLGPDPLEDRLDSNVLHQAFGSSRAAIKPLLMDNSVIAGVGNIQATEALFRARIHPCRPANTLTDIDRSQLAQSIIASIEHTLEVHARDEEIVYLSEKTGIPNPFLAYGRAGQPCPRCSSPFEDLTLAGRPSVYCPKCQPTPTRSAPRHARG